MMQKVGYALKSRTVWTLVVMFIVSGISGIHDLIPSGWLPVVDGILGLLIVYFHVNPQRNYNS